jgi:hypothetical protein
MYGGERNLPFHKNFPIVLLYKGGKDEYEEAYASENADPPREIVAQNYCWYLS